jgi:hypothetical protein
MLIKLEDGALIEMYKNCGVLANKYDLPNKSTMLGYNSVVLAPSPEYNTANYAWDNQVRGGNQNRRSDSNKTIYCDFVYEDLLRAYQAFSTIDPFYGKYPYNKVVATIPETGKTIIFEDRDLLSKLINIMLSSRTTEVDYILRLIITVGNLKFDAVNRTIYCIFNYEDLVIARQVINIIATKNGKYHYDRVVATIPKTGKTVIFGDMTSLNNAISNMSSNSIAEPEIGKTLTSEDMDSLNDAINSISSIIPSSMETIRTFVSEKKDSVKNAISIIINSITSTVTAKVDAVLDSARAEGNLVLDAANRTIYCDFTYKNLVIAREVMGKIATNNGKYHYDRVVATILKTDKTVTFGDMTSLNNAIRSMPPVETDDPETGKIFTAEEMFSLLIAINKVKNAIKHSKHYAKADQSGNPRTLLEALKVGFRPVPPEEARWHRQGEGNEYNIKMVHTDGREAVYNKEELLVTDPLNLGSMNEFVVDSDLRSENTIQLISKAINFGKNFIGHGYKDVSPYFPHGNTIDDNPGLMGRISRLFTNPPIPEDYKVYWRWVYDYDKDMEEYKKMFYLDNIC